MTGDGKVVHLAGENDDGINAQVKPEHLFTICGKTFNKARVTIDDFWDIVLEDKACINNSRDKKCWYFLFVLMHRDVKIFIYQILLHL